MTIQEKLDALIVEDGMGMPYSPSVRCQDASSADPETVEGSSLPAFIIIAFIAFAAFMVLLTQSEITVTPFVQPINPYSVE